MNETKFDGMGELYSKFRPKYPTSFINYLYLNVGITTTNVIADIGSGTGILTKHLLEKGNKVYAVEPNQDMRNVAQADLQHYNTFISVNATAENTTLLADCVDFVTVAQAFHWFNRQAFKVECKRILKPTGKIILVWNSRDEASKLVKENDDINKKFCPNFKGFSGGMRGAITNDDDFGNFFDGEYEIKTFNNPLLFNKEGFIGRNLSASYALKPDDKNYADYVLALKKLFEQYSENDMLCLPNITRSYVGKVDL